MDQKTADMLRQKYPNHVPLDVAAKLLGTSPRGTNNQKVWDTSNRAINVVINNLKGIFFDDDDFEHMSCSVVANWGEIGMTEVRICDHEDLKKCEIFR